MHFSLLHVLIHLVDLLITIIALSMTCCLNSILGSVYEISDLDDYHLSTIFSTWYIRWRLFIFKVVRKYEYKLDFFYHSFMYVTTL